MLKCQLTGLHLKVALHIQAISPCFSKKQISTQLSSLFWKQTQVTVLSRSLICFIQNNHSKFPINCPSLPTLQDSGIFFPNRAAYFQTQQHAPRIMMNSPKIHQLSLQCELRHLMPCLQLQNDMSFPSTCLIARNIIISPNLGDGALHREQPY